MGLISLISKAGSNIVAGLKNIGGITNIGGKPVLAGTVDIGGVSKAPSLISKVGTTVLKGAESIIKGTAKVVAGAFVKAPVATTAGIVVGIPTVAGIISKKPELITQLPKKSFEAGQKLVGVVEEHPVATAVLAGTGLAGVGVLAAKYLDKGTEIVQNTLPTDNANVPTASVNPAVSTNQATPVVPATTQITTGTKGSAKRKKYKKKREVPMINIKIDNREDNDVYDRKVYKGGHR